MAPLGVDTGPRRLKRGRLRCSRDGTCLLGTNVHEFPRPRVDFILRAARLTLSGYTARASPSKGRLMRYTVPGSTLKTT
jgi:hypothetical protein